MTPLRIDPATFPASSAVPQPTAPSHIPLMSNSFKYKVNSDLHGWTKFWDLLCYTGSLWITQLSGMRRGVVWYASTAVTWKPATALFCTEDGRRKFLGNDGIFSARLHGVKSSKNIVILFIWDNLCAVNSKQVRKTQKIWGNKTLELVLHLAPTMISAGTENCRFSRHDKQSCWTNQNTYA